MSTDLNLEEAIKLQRFKTIPGPVEDHDTLATLIAVAMVCNVEENEGRAISFETLLIEVRDLLAEGQTISEKALRDALARGVCGVAEVPGGWRWE